MLSELTSAIVWLNSSPIESFVHIYRTLEFMSYSFPMIYASKSMDYRGSYEHLKKFMNGDSDGELKFFKTFLKELFKNNILLENKKLKNETKEIVNKILKIKLLTSSSIISSSIVLSFILSTFNFEEPEKENQFICHNQSFK